jgi:hypothetical protein
MTLHLLLPVRQAPQFLHAWDADGVHYECHTTRGAGQCTCGRYRLCDPLHHRCAEDCACPCHQKDDFYG